MRLTRKLKVKPPPKKVKPLPPKGHKTIKTKKLRVKSPKNKVKSPTPKGNKKPK